ncbi:hypothetical protein N2000095 [Escherichia phage vB_EcoS_HZ_ZJUN2]
MGKLQKQILPYIDYIREIIEYNPYTGKLFYKPNKYKNKTWHTLYAGRERYVVRTLMGISELVCS